MIDQPEPTRVCATCSCFGYMSADGKVGARDPTQQEQVPICRRNTPGAKYVQVEVPVLDASNQPVMGRNGPRTNFRQVLQIGYPPTTPEAVCFDGWRPLGTLPGLAHLARH